MKTAMTLTAIAALAGISATAFTQNIDAPQNTLVHETADGKAYYLASTLLQSRLAFTDGDVAIKDLLVDEAGNLHAVVVDNPNWLDGDAAIAADLVYLAGAPGNEMLRVDITHAEFDMLAQGGGYEPIGLSWATEYDGAQSARALMGEAIDVSASAPGIAIDDLEISQAGAVMAVHFENTGWRAVGELDGRIPVNALQFDYDQPSGWTVATTVNDAQINALAGRDTSLFLSASNAS
tara:strand:- start:400 stop:1107 length:708 start_codon:yes stop_codon:yes gene_type:complete